MKSKIWSRIFWVFLIPVASFLLWQLTSCSNNPGTAYGQLIRHTDCKSFPVNQEGVGGFTHPPSEECLEYSYDGRGRLTIKHINAAFNCCPGTISAEVVILPGEIRIKEKEASALCDCNCLFDLDYELINIRPGVYRISVKGPYQPEDEPPLEFVVALKGPVSGTFCVPRTKYPWH